MNSLKKIREIKCNEEETKIQCLSFESKLSKLQKDQSATHEDLKEGKKSRQVEETVDKELTSDEDLTTEESAVSLAYNQSDTKTHGK